MKVVTWNVNGIRARKDELDAFLTAEQPDVVCLQEIKAAPEQIPDLVRDRPGYHVHWHGMKGYSGVALLVRQSLVGERPTFSHPRFDHECRVVAVELPQATVASVYVPNGGKDYDAKIAFLESLASYGWELHQRRAPAILCGDINVALTDRDVHPKERKEGAIGQRPDERALVERILADGGLHDVTRELDPDNAELFTWWAPWRNLRQRNIGWRIDYVLATADLRRTASSCRSLRDTGTSDHAPLVATFGA